MFIEVRKLIKSYQTGSVAFRALNEINFSINTGEKCVVLGPSGSGKTTLINIIGAIDTADSGEILIDGMDITKLTDNKKNEYRRNSVGFVFQFFNLIPNLTVYENVEVASNISSQPLCIDKILDSVGMSELSNRFPRELSGGQQQRVAIARALVKKPKILLCDEPTGALDYENSKDILKLLENVGAEYHITIMIITHNNAISNMADHIIRLRGGEIAEDRLNNKIIPAERIEW